MAPQHDFILDNQNGAQFRADLNLALEAIATFSSGAVEPTTSYAYQYWADTTTGYLKQRDASNADWIVRGKLAADYGQAGQVLTSAGADEPAIWTSITEDGAWTVAQDGTNSHFTFTGNGFDGTETNPDIYLVRGAVYNFTNASTTKGFQIQSTAGLSGTAYNDGITNNPALAPNSSTVSTLVWTVQMDAPSELYYHSTVDAGPGGNIYILDESIGGALEWTLTANGTTDYIFAGPGFAGTETDPTIYVVRGQTYKFTNSMGAHPFQIQSTQGIGGTAYSDGITNNAVSNGTLTWEVRMDAPSTLYYQCTSHADMNGTIYVLDEGGSVAVASIDDIGDVDTSTAAPTDGQALVWDAANSQWEPGTVSGGGGGTSLPAAQDGEALIYENGQWVAGPVIGGVDYTPAGDPDFSSVELLLLGNGTNGSQTITDSSSNSRTATVAGNTQISTTQSKYGGASIYFDGNGDYLEFTSDAALADWYSTGGFTVEAWVYAASWSGWLISMPSGDAPVMVGNSSATQNTAFWSFGPDNSGNVTFQYYSNARYSVTSSATLSTGTWHHIAATYDGTTIRVFIDGNLDGSATVIGTPVIDLNFDLLVGTINGTYITGYIDDLRITQGVARYTANFTAPTSQLPTNVTDLNFNSVKLLLLGNGTNGSTTITDSSSLAKTVTANGNAVISTTQSKFGGASLYFPGATSDFMTVPNSTDWDFGTGDFTLEAWVYIDGNSPQDAGGLRTATIANTWTSAGTIVGWNFTVRGDATTTGTGISLDSWDGLGNATQFTATTTVSQQVWHHIAATVESGTRRIFLDGTLVSGSTNTIGSGYSSFVANTLYIGKTLNASYPLPLNGYIDDLRITKGVARYTANFTAPTLELPAASGAAVTIPYSIDKLDDVDTSTVAPTDGQALVWDNTAQKWEPGTVSGGGGISRAQATAITLVFS